MKLVYHPLVQRDVNRILRHYDKISRLGDEFWAELMRLVELVAAKPGRFHIGDRALRRASMRRFPYHVLFRESPVGIRVIVVRHDRRHQAMALGEAKANRAAPGNGAIASGCHALRGKRAVSEAA